MQNTGIGPLFCIHPNLHIYALMDEIRRKLLTVTEIKQPCCELSNELCVFYCQLFFCVLA
jgi:hypothetical protein